MNVTEGQSFTEQDQAVEKGAPALLTHMLHLPQRQTEVEGFCISWDNHLPALLISKGLLRPSEGSAWLAW